MDFNVDNYNCDELLNMLGISHNKLYINLNNINQATINSIKNVKNEKKNENKRKIITFLLKAHHKLCKKYNINIPIHTIKEFKTLTNNILINKNIQPTDYLIEYKQNSKTLNPISRQTHTNILTINSKYRKNFYDTKSSNFVVDFPEPFKNVISLKLSSAEIQNTYYSFSEAKKSNRFYIIRYEQNKDDKDDIINKVEYKIEVRNGNYTGQQMEQHINLILASFDSETGISFIKSNYNSNNGLFTFKKSSDAISITSYDLKFDLKFDLDDEPDRDLILNMGWMLGYYKNLYTYDDYYQTTETVTKDVGFNPDAPLDFTGTRVFFIEVNDFKKNYPQTVFYPLDGNSFNMDNVIAKIPNVASMNLIFEDSSDKIYKKRIYNGPVDINKLHIKIIDEHGYITEFNNGELILSFELVLLDVHYKEFNEQKVYNYK